MLIPIYVPIHPYIHPPTYTSIHPSIYLSIYLYARAHTHTQNPALNYALIKPFRFNIPCQFTPLITFVPSFSI